jgi:2-polyprenyl-6-methoxyphenol hydroxylase-like FAD-dependent oxidoreductase
VHLQSLTNHGAGLTIIEATSDGWWYTSPIPEAGRALAFLTDRDLPEAKSASNFENLPLRACESTLEVSRVLGRARNPAIVAQGYTSANGSFLEPPIGDHWLAVGDAALTIDPIAARGLLHALYTGSVAGASIERKLSGQATTFDEYARTVASLVAEYQRLWRIGYARETRFPGSTFWQRRVRQNSL